MAPNRGPGPSEGPDPSESDDPNGRETLTISRGLLGNNTVSFASSSSEVMATLAAPGLSDEPALNSGDRLGRFEIDRQLGVGGMGQVFAAQDLESGEVVALKYLERTSASLLYRFKQEFRALAGVTHENLVALGELVVLPDQATFFTMELVDGVPFDEYVRGRSKEGVLPNIARLKRALRQLVSGVRHLHLNDCIHRDLKPSNVLVTPEGRVVVLDFGLVQDASDAALEDEPDDQIMGTPAYMSPEQAGLERAGPPADYYAVGVMLYECLCGKRPFRGTVARLLFAKREFEAPDVREQVEEVPEDLAELCRRLLSRDPGERPSGREILTTLGGADGFIDPGASLTGSTISGRAPFVGRRRELGVLEDAWRVMLAGRPVTVHVRGRSGYGKSALVREFLSSLREQTSAVVLRGRCLERESVPYKGLDAVVDSLSVHLRALPRERLIEIQPDHPAALVRLFPVLGDLWAADRTRTSGLDVYELRQRAFTALRQLFSALGQERPLVVFIDDFQWANVDSARLLNELLRPPEAPQMLFVVAYRDEVADNETLQALTAAGALVQRDIREVFIGPLSQEDTRDLALVLMEERDEEIAATYAAGAEGSPFYVGQMVRGASAEGATPGKLDQLVVRRILQLDQDSRRLLEVVAVAGGPVSRQAVIEASGLSQTQGLISPLREAELLRVRGSNSTSATLEAAHDRIREVTVGELAPDDLRETHLRLAEALERLGSDPESLAVHYERGGDRCKAADYFERAAEHAANSLAFQRSVALFRRTLELLEQAGDVEPARLMDLRTGLADQLINVGRGHEAAQLLLSLAEDTEQAEVARSREFRRRAADQLIKTGHVDEGLAELDALLRSVGMSLPKGKTASLVALLREQARLKLRGFGFTKRDVADIDPALLDQVDTCWAVVNGLSTQEVLLSVTFHLRNLRLSLGAGEPRRIARAIAYQCVIEVAGRDWSRVDEHLRIARELASEIDDPGLNAFIDVCEASLHWFERRYTVSTRMHTKVLESSEGMPGTAWELRTARVHHLWTLANKGNFGEFMTRAQGTIARARERGDMQEVIEVSSFEAMVRVLTGDVVGAEQLIAQALADWNPGRYLFGDVWCYYAKVRILLWNDEPEQAVALSKETQAQMSRTFLDQNALASGNVLEMLARSYLIAAILRDNQGYARRAKRLSTKVRAIKNPVLTGLAEIIDAGLASLAGDRRRALKAWTRAEKIFLANEMAKNVAAVRMRQAQVLGDEGEGPRLMEDAQIYLESEGITDPAAVDGFMRLVAPARIDRFGGGGGESGTIRL
ncbi:protein kinase [Pseudenhygromyxa sp. WMMC2535]|uniref:serine/threonine-protein kinase n=1 Tax=Pseudenhygromyxa sp. WMMC2535 TaxID=2712867 RepID=UPI0015557ADA|nr:serine/threonine-protein kinase [Pseudenhygromyxa sp. WMMC2535]NVB41898.1 protein kinase [Pseudenhygromyxa sp. WMMC2535]